MPKLPLPELTGGYADAALINEALAAVEDFSDNVVTRDGTAPNSMASDLDMDSNEIVNLGDPSTPLSAVNLRTLDRLSSGVMRQVIEIVDIPADLDVLGFGDLRYTVGTNNLAVYRDGRRLSPGVRYIELDSGSIQFTPPWGSPAEIMAVTNEFLGTTTFDLPNVPWTNITGAPVYTTRWPAWSEVTGKPTVSLAGHGHFAHEVTLDVTNESMSDSARGVHVQVTAPTASRVGELWFW
jgi:hypothetical protein